MDKRDRIARAKSLVNDEMFRVAWEDIGTRIVSEWKQAKTPEEREQKHAELKALDRAFNRLEVWAAEPNEGNENGR